MELSRVGDSEPCKYCKILPVMEADEHQREQCALTIKTCDLCMVCLTLRITPKSMTAASIEKMMKVFAAYGFRPHKKFGQEAAEQWSEATITAERNVLYCLRCERPVELQRRCMHRFECGLDP